MYWIRRGQALRPDAAPTSVEHVCAIADRKLYDGCCFYRSDFVIQAGLQRPDGSAVRPRRPGGWRAAWQWAAGQRFLTVHGGV